VLGLGDEFDKLDEVGCQLGAHELGAQAVEWLDENGLAEGVEIAPPAGSPTDVIEEEEVELAGKGAPGTAGAFGHGLEAPVGLGEPGDDPTGIAEPCAAEENGGGAVHVLGNESFDARMVMGKKSFMPEVSTQPAAPDNTPTLDIDNLKTTYANVCRIIPTPNEIIVDFGMNPNFFGPVLSEALKLDSRIIMSPDGAKRLTLHLGSILQAFEAKYGVIELDVAKRIKQPAAQPAS
jgi:hypothetical protein